MSSPISEQGLSVVVPAHNEAENVAALVEEIRFALQAMDKYEILYVDDGSEDETHTRLRAIARDFPKLRVVCHRVRCGQSTAIHTGVKMAHYPWIVTLDGDGQNNPSDIPAFLDAMEKNRAGNQALMICGYRKVRKDSLVKRVSSRIANAFRGNLLKDDTPDTGCGLKLFSREVFLALPYFDHMHRFLPALMLRSGGKIVSLEVGHRPRLRGKTNYGVHNRLWVGLMDVLGVMWLQRRAKRPDIIERE